MAMRPGVDSGSLCNVLLSRCKGEAPKVGMGATILMWTDRKACSVIEVKGDVVSVREDKAIRVDNRGMSDWAEYRYEDDPAGAVRKFSLRKSGEWIEVGSRSGCRLLIGKRDHFYDYSF